MKKTGDLSLKLDNVNPTEYVATSMVVLGTLIFAISFCGCCGAIRESECLLNLYSLALVFVAFFQLVMALYTCLYKDDIRNGTEKAWNTLWDGKSSELNTKAIREIQKFISCCGDSGITSYPISISRGPASDCEFKNYARGCRNALKEYVTDSSSIISYVSLTMALVEVISYIFHRK